VPANDTSTDATLVTTPALDSSMSVSTMRGRTGWLTTSSASVVVKPTPERRAGLEPGDVV
jgi:hypothetical protein